MWQRRGVTLAEDDNNQSAVLRKGRRGLQGHFCRYVIKTQRHLFPFLACELKRQMTQQTIGFSHAYFVVQLVLIKNSNRAT